MASAAIMHISASAAGEAEPTVSASNWPMLWISLATRPVQPVWWEAPSPAPLSPWKYS